MKQNESGWGILHNIKGHMFTITPVNWHPYRPPSLYPDTKKTKSFLSRSSRWHLNWICVPLLPLQFIMLTYIFMLAWLGVTAFTSLPVFIYFNIWNICQNATVLEGTSLCLDPRQYGKNDFHFLSTVPMSIAQLCMPSTMLPRTHTHTLLETTHIHWI